MKSVIKILAVIASMIFSPIVIINHVSAQDDSYQTFYDNLSPYGEWVYEPNYGYVWVAAEGPGFTPYSTGGHWVYTDDGWTWVSDYPWGWATFHYGRWDQDPEYGWFWVPGEEWAPAWVVWYDAPGYYGWAPIGPGISIEAAYGGGYYIPPERRTYCDSRYITSNNVQNYYAPRNQYTTIIKNTTIINNTNIDNRSHTTIAAGPRREDVQKRTGASIQPVSIRESSRPGSSVSGNQLNIYRPAVAKSTSSNPKPAPNKVATKSDVKPVSQRTSGGSVLKEGAKPTYNNQRTQPTKTTPQKTVTPNREVTPSQQKVTPSQQKETQTPQRVTPSYEKTPPPAQKETTTPQKQTQPARVTPTPQKETTPPAQRTTTPTQQKTTTPVARPHQRYYTPRSTTTPKTTAPAKPSTPPPTHSTPPPSSPPRQEERK